MKNATGVILVLLLAALCFWVAFSSNLQNAVAQFIKTREDGKIDEKLLLNYGNTDENTKILMRDYYRRNANAAGEMGGIASGGGRAFGKLVK